MRIGEMMMNVMMDDVVSSSIAVRKLCLVKEIICVGLKVRVVVVILTVVLLVIVVKIVMSEWWLCLLLLWLLLWLLLSWLLL